VTNPNDDRRTGYVDFLLLGNRRLGFDVHRRLPFSTRKACKNASRAAFAHEQSALIKIQALIAPLDARDY